MKAEAHLWAALDLCASGHFLVRPGTSLELIAGEQVVRRWRKYARQAAQQQSDVVASKGRAHRMTKPPRTDDGSQMTEHDGVVSARSQNSTDLMTSDTPQRNGLSPRASQLHRYTSARFKMHQGLLALDWVQQILERDDTSSVVTAGALAANDSKLPIDHMVSCLDKLVNLDEFRRKALRVNYDPLLLGRTLRCVLNCSYSRSGKF